MGLAGLSDFHLAAAHGGSRGRPRNSALLFAMSLIVQSERLQSAALRVILSTSSSLPALRIQMCAILLGRRAVAPSFAEADTRVVFGYNLLRGARGTVTNDAGLSCERAARGRNLRSETSPS